MFMNQGILQQSYSFLAQFVNGGFLLVSEFYLKVFISEVATVMALAYLFCHGYGRNRSFFELLRRFTTC